MKFETNPNTEIGSPFCPSSFSLSFWKRLGVSGESAFSIPAALYSIFEFASNFGLRISNFTP